MARRVPAAWPERRARARAPRRCSLVLARDLDEVAARVVEDSRRHGLHLHGLLGEANAELAESLVLGVDVFDSERRERDAVGHERLLERPHGGIAVGLEHE